MKSTLAAPPSCLISQPTLSVAVKKLEDELDVKIFERSAARCYGHAAGREIVRQAQSVLEQAAEIKESPSAAKTRWPALTLGVIYTIGPYLLPELVRQNIARTPQMPLMLQENFTVKLLEMLRTGEIDCAILAEPFPTPAWPWRRWPYDEPFYGRAQQPRAGGAKRVHEPEERNHAAAGHRPLLSRPCAGGLPRVCALRQQRRGHPPHVRGLVAGDHQTWSPPAWA